MASVRLGPGKADVGAAAGTAPADLMAAGRPSASEPAVTRNNSLFAARSRHPMHVRTGPGTGVETGDTDV